MSIKQPMTFSTYDLTDPNPGKRVLTFRVNDVDNRPPIELTPADNQYTFEGNHNDSVEWWLADHDSLGNTRGAASGVFVLLDTIGPAIPTVTLGEQYQ